MSVTANIIAEIRKPGPICVELTGFHWIHVEVNKTDLIEQLQKCGEYCHWEVFYPECENSYRLFASKEIINGDEA